ncbi:MAG: class I SAM-dependent methyltransferase [Lachnospiraceae bacterium]|nr:class I SAM-dependent methyltransferase [Lachnospiraceae bacterium]
MDAYTDFASVYDEFMENTPYDEWCADIVDKLKDFGITGGLVCELGAGTGEMTRRLRDKGFDMIGIDSSEEMLMKAREKEGESSDILYLCQDMREFELYGTVAAIVSVCDCINYILEESELVTVFKLVNNYLDPSGIFIFDFNTKHKYRDVIGESTIAENREDESFIWENFYDEEGDINEYDITFFVREGELFRRFTETHLQRGYDLAEMRAAVEASGLVFVKAYDADTKGDVTDTSERVVVIARECGK